jgi:hypothetical protein
VTVQRCLQAHYAVIVEAHKDAEIYQLGEVDCPSCLRRMLEKHEALAAIFRARLDACCVGDPDCRSEVP